MDKDSTWCHSPRKYSQLAFSNPHPTGRVTDGFEAGDGKDWIRQGHLPGVEKI